MSVPEPLLSQQHIRLKKCRHGAMLYNVNVNDTYVGRSLDLYGEFSEAEVQFFSNVLQPGMMVIDVGANVGTYSLMAASLVGPSVRVLAFEPVPATRARLAFSNPKRCSRARKLI